MTFKYSINSLLWSFLLSFVSTLCLAQEEPKEKETIPPKVEMLSFKVKITDPDGHPLEGATVFPSGLRSKAEPGSHWGWPDEEYGTLPKLTTDKDGLVEMPYPKYLTDKLETGTVTLSVEHPDFVTFREDRSVGDAPAEIQLKRGFRIAATAVDAESGEALKDDLYGLISGDGYSRLKDWKLASNGMLVSPVFESQKSWLRVIKVSEGQPVLYSDLIEIDPEDKGRVLLRDVKLTRGARVEGKLDDSVKRPIKNGYVAAEIIHTGSSDPAQRWDSRWSWMDKTSIAEDGTFVFESLPRDEILQMIPICDDWVPTNLTKEDLLPIFPDEVRMVGVGFTLPQLTRLDKPTVTTTLKMTPATSVRVKVTDQDGNPLSDVEVMSCPNQYWFGGGSQILGDVFATTEWLIASKKGEFNFDRKNRYSGKTDEQGVVTLKHMPPKKTESLYAQLKGYEMPLNGTDREVAVNLKPDEIAEVTIRMQPEGTQVLDDGAYNKAVAEDDDDESKTDSKQTEGDMKEEAEKEEAKKEEAKKDKKKS